MRHALAVSLLAAGLAAGPACAHNHYQLTTRQVVIGAAVITGVVLLVVLAADRQCDKGPAPSCDQPPPTSP